MRVGFLVRHEFHTVGPYEGVASVEELLLEHAFVVVMDGGRYLGILTAPDLVRAPRSLVVDCLRELPAVEDDADLRDVLEVMKSSYTTVLPVLRDGSFAGVCVRSDIADHLEVSRGELEGDLARSTSELRAEVGRRQATEEALRRSERQYREIVETANEGVWLLTAEGDTTFVNARVSESLGLEAAELLGRPIADFVVLEDRACFRARLDSVVEGSRDRFEVRLRSRDGRVRWFLISMAPRRDAGGRVVGVIAMLADVTEQKSLEQAFHQAQKMEALGTLAGGIAHDFNNILTPIMALSDLVLVHTPAGSVTRGYAEGILAGAERARALVRQILTITRRQSLSPQPLDVRPLVKETLKLLRSSLPTTVEIRQRLSAEIGAVRVDPAQMHQVLLNLCTNAHRAMPEGGLLEVEVDRVVLASDTPDRPRGLGNGEYLRVAVRDSGCGIPPELADKIFEPYFTTRPPGEGSGLGLAVVQGIVAASGGAVTVESAPGRGSTFSVFLPEVRESAPQVSPATSGLSGGDERILLVDDQADVLGACSAMLGHLGYRVTATTSSVEAMELLRARPESFDLLLTDLTMPGLTGADLTREALEVRPRLAVLVMTGEGMGFDEEGARRLGARAFVAKPLTLAGLAEAVRRALAPPVDRVA